MARICEFCGEAYADDRAVCGNDGRPLESWGVATLRLHGQSLKVAAARAGAADPSDPQEQVAPPELRAGRVLSNRYMLMETIGVGGFGVVFRALDRRLGKQVAVKVLSPQLACSPKVTARFRQEAFAASHVGHPGIVDVTDFDCDEDGTRFLVMEFLDGHDLASVIEREGALQPARALEIAGQVTAAIAAAHDKGIVHRDLKPANVFLVRRPGQADQVKILDFGISKMTAVAAAPNALTGDGQIMGTPHYLSPEQARGDAVIDGRTDIYSLGVILYELLCGERVFTSSNYLGMVTQHLVAVPVPPSVRNPAIPPVLDALVLRALEKEPGRRFPSMHAFGAAIADVAAGLGGAAAREGVPAEPAVPLVGAPTRPGTATVNMARRRGRAWVLVLALVGAAGGTGAALLRARGDRGAPRPSSRRAVVAASPLTRLGGCPFSPTFLDDGTVAFEWSRGDEVRRLLRMPLEGGAPTRLTAGSLAESDPTAGHRPGQLLYRVEDPEAQSRVGSSRLVLRELATGAESALEIATTSAAASGDTLYYARLDHGEIRRRRGQVDEAFLPLTGDRTVGVLAAAPDGRSLALISNAQGTPVLCLVNLEGEPRLRCLDRARPIRGRIAFAPDARVIYYPATDGVHRIDVQTEADELAVPGIVARAGVAVSPAGDALVLSDCRPRGPLLDVSTTPPTVAVDDAVPREPTGGPGGRLAYVGERDGRAVLVVREGEGTVHELTAPGQGSPSSPSFDPSGRWIAFELGGTAAPGIYVIDAAGHYPPERLTSNPHDSDPIWTADARVAFTRWDDQQNPSVMLIDRAGGEPQRAPLGSRKTVAHAIGTGELLLESKDKEQLYLWTPGQGRERPLPLGPLAGRYFMASGIAHDGRFVVVQSGANGRQVWRLWRDGRAPEPLFAAGNGQSMSSVALMSDGRILVGVRTWSGELHLARAPAGTHF
jgi:hypothetical protein